MKSLNPRIGLSVFLAALLSIAIAATAHAQSTTKTPRVDVNSADVETLETLPGIGPTLANRIVAGRPYKNASDLEKVQGLSKSKIDAIQDQITFGTSKKTTKSAKKSASTGSAAADTSDAQKGSKAVSPTGSATGKLAPGQTININTATAEELDALPGIGPPKAQAIIDYRNENGRFNSIEDVQKVKGIKEGEFSKIKDMIRVR